jgi:hypothetical protein
VIDLVGRSGARTLRPTLAQYQGEYAEIGSNITVRLWETWKYRATMPRCLFSE